MEQSYEIRTSCIDDIEAIACIEKTCFPNGEEVPEKAIADRLTTASEFTYVAVESHQVIGFISGIAMDSDCFTDDCFTNARLHQKTGNYVMLVGLAVLPSFRNQGIASQLLTLYLEEMKKQNKLAIELTCDAFHVQFYERAGFHKIGIADSAWGNQKWYLMRYLLSE